MVDKVASVHVQRNLLEAVSDLPVYSFGGATAPAANCPWGGVFGSVRSR